MSLDNIETLSSILKAIERIKDNDVEIVHMDSSPLTEHWVGYGEPSRLVYVSAEIGSEDLTKGTEPSNDAEGCARAYGCGDDRLRYIIPKELGGPGAVYNVFPQYSGVRSLV